MSIEKAITAGLTGEKISRTITGTSEVSAGRTVVSTVAGAALGAGATVATAALVAGAAPLVVPVAVAAGAVSFIRSLWD